MACAHPLTIRKPVFVPSIPRYFLPPHDYYVPCGYCVNCIRDKQNFFCDRAEYEYTKRLTASFLTLTYNDIELIERCAVTDQFGAVWDYENGRKTIRTSINYKDVRNFLHSLREYIRRHTELHNVLCQPDFSFAYVGEYGGLYKRCHFHVLIFGLDFAYCASIFRKLWKFGIIDVLPLLDGGIRYVTKYMDKALKGYPAWLEYDCRSVSRPKLCTSTGFGSSLLWDNVEDIVDNFYTYKVPHNKRRPISAYWKYLLTGYMTCFDVTKKSYFVQDPYYVAIRKISTARSMKELNFHHRVNIYSDYEQRKFRLQQALHREESLKIQLRRDRSPVYDNISDVMRPRFGYVTYDGDIIRKLTPASQRLLHEEYLHHLNDKWLLSKFPENFPKSWNLSKK